MTKKLGFVRLYDLERGSGAEIHGLELTIDGKTVRDAVVVFDHVDGMYSYNTVNDKNGDQMFHKKEGNPCLVHLGNTMLLKKVGDHYVVATNKECEAYEE